MRAPLLAVLAAALVLASCGDDKKTVSGEPPDSDVPLGVTSPDFAGGQSIPAQFTCDGRDVSPRLRWRGVPADAREMALLVEDPDSSEGIFVHWAAWGMSPQLKELPSDPDPSLLIQGKNSFGKVGYSGPCPPKGDRPHRYNFIVYALRKPLGLDAGAEAQTVRQTIATVVDAKGTLVGVYGR
jgi:Raf kinase inhibitor-like YbhB/YbcL family protein